MDILLIWTTSWRFFAVLSAFSFTRNRVSHMVGAMGDFRTARSRLLRAGLFNQGIGTLCLLDSARRQSKCPYSIRHCDCAVQGARSILDVFRSSCRERFCTGELFELQLLSDAGKAHQSYADGRAGQNEYHQRHYRCYRHLLENLGSGTIVALLASYLLFTRTEEAFREIYSQTVAHFVLGCRKQLMSDPGRKKFGKLFGIDLTQWDEDEFPIMNLDVFK
jgi:hypothetical protein